MRIVFIHAQTAFLPEIPAYQNYFEALGIETRVCRTGEEQFSGADVYWYFMGLHAKRAPRGIVVIHEYASASTGPFRILKDRLKRRLNARPDFRIYLNAYVRERLGFRDQTPFGFRDMGVSDRFLKAPKSRVQTFDFVYAGSLDPRRNIRWLLKPFYEGALRDRSILLIGADDQELALRMKPYPNIHFVGPVDHADVSDYLQMARYAINYIPDREPFNQQTSTKFLEYCALGMPVITTRYHWISAFQQEHGGAFFFLEEDCTNLFWEAVTKTIFSAPDLRGFRWEEKITGAKIVDFLRARFPDQPFRSSPGPDHKNP